MFPRTSIDQAVDEGRVFTHSGTQSVANNATYDHLIVTPARMHVDLVNIIIDVEGSPFEMFLYESPTVSNNGTALALNNENRNSGKVAQTLAFHTPTVSATGTQLRYRFVSGTGAAGYNLIAIDSNMALKPATKYLMRMLNISGATRDTGLEIKICEPGMGV